MKELVYNHDEYTHIKQDVEKWANLFQNAIKNVVETQQFTSKKIALKDKYNPNTAVVGRLIESFEDSLAMLIYEYKILGNKKEYNGIRECKVFATFLYHFMRLMPFPATKLQHLTIFFAIINQIGKSHPELTIAKDAQQLFMDKFGHDISERNIDLHCVYAICRLSIFE